MKLKLERLEANIRYRENIALGLLGVYLLSLLVFSQTRYWENTAYAYVSLSVSILVILYLAALIKAQLKAYSLQREYLADLEQSS